MSWIFKNISKKLPNGVSNKSVKFGGKWISPKGGSPPSKFDKMGKNAIFYLKNQYNAYKLTFIT